VKILLTNHYAASPAHGMEFRPYYFAREWARIGHEVTIAISEPDHGRRCWQDKPEAQQAVYGNRQRIRGEHGKKLLRRRGELLERSFAHVYETGGRDECTCAGAKIVSSAC
jgi:hypothetical protein